MHYKTYNSNSQNLSLRGTRRGKKRKHVVRRRHFFFSIYVICGHKQVHVFKADTQASMLSVLQLFGPEKPLLRNPSKYQDFILGALGFIIKCLQNNFFCETQECNDEPSDLISLWIV